MYSKAEIFVNILILFSVLIILIQYLFILTEEQLIIIYFFDFNVVAILVINFCHRMRRSKQCLKFLVKYWYEIPAMLPLVTFSFIEGFNTSSVIAILRLIRLLVLFHLFYQTLRAVRGKNKIAYVILFSIASISIGATVEYLIESPNPNSKITNLGNAFWWAIATVTTVGYGDVYPVTSEGRIVARF